MVKNILPLLLLLIAISTPLRGETTVQKGQAWQLVDETVAVVNGEPILFSDIKLYMLLFRINNPKEALERLINIYLVAQYAKSRGLQIPPSKVQEIITNFAKSQGKSVEELYKNLQQLGLGGAVFSNFVRKYNLYVAAIQFFVLKPLYSNQTELENLIAAYAPQSIPMYTLKVLRIPKTLAEKYQNLLITEDFQKISKRLNIKPIEFTTSLKELKPEIASVVKRLKVGQTDFAEDKNYIYLVKVEKIEYKVPQKEKSKILKRIEEKKIKEFINSLRENSVVKILPEAKKSLNLQ